MLKKKLNTGIWPMLILLIVALISTALLALTNTMTAETIAEREAEEAMKVRRALFPEAEKFETLELPERWQDDAKTDRTVSNLAEAARDKDGQLLGLLIRSHAKGYGGEVPVYLAMDAGGKIVGIEMPANDETPGLGQKVRAPKFYEQFIGRSAEDFFMTGSTQIKKDDSGEEVADSPEVVKKPLSIDAVSGATISSTAVADALNKISDIFNELIREVE